MKRSARYTSHQPMGTYRKVIGEDEDGYEWRRRMRKERKREEWIEDAREEEGRGRNGRIEEERKGEGRREEEWRGGSDS